MMKMIEIVSIMNRWKLNNMMRVKTHEHDDEHDKIILNDANAEHEENYENDEIMIMMKRMIKTMNWIT